VVWLSPKEFVVFAVVVVQRGSVVRNDRWEVGQEWEGHSLLLAAVAEGTGSSGHCDFRCADRREKTFFLWDDSAMTRSFFHFVNWTKSTYDSVVAAVLVDQRPWPPGQQLRSQPNCWFEAAAEVGMRRWKQEAYRFSEEKGTLSVQVLGDVRRSGRGCYCYSDQNPF